MTQALHLLSFVLPFELEQMLLAYPLPRVTPNCLTTKIGVITQAYFVQPSLPTNITKFSNSLKHHGPGCGKYKCHLNCYFSYGSKCMHNSLPTQNALFPHLIYNQIPLSYYEFEWKMNNIQDSRCTPRIDQQLNLRIMCYLIKV